MPLLAPLAVREDLADLARGRDLEDVAAVLAHHVDVALRVDGNVARLDELVALSVPGSIENLPDLAGGCDAEDVVAEHAHHVDVAPGVHGGPERPLERVPLSVPRRIQDHADLGPRHRDRGTHHEQRNQQDPVTPAHHRLLSPPASILTRLRHQALR